MFHLKNHHAKDGSSKICLKGQAIWMYEAILYIVDDHNILLCKLIYGCHKKACLN